MGLKLTNNAASRLAAGIGISSTTISVTPGDGALFPTLSSGEWFPATLINASNAIEIVRVTARSGDIFTVDRGQEGTAAAAFLAGDRIELRATAGILSSLMIPVGTGPLPYSLPTEPVGWIFCDGRALLSSTPYLDLRNLYIAAGFPFGNDGSGNPLIPDMRGRVAAGLDNMGAGAAGRLTGATLGAGLGAQTHALTSAEMPVHAHGVNDPSHTHGAWQDDHYHTLSGIAMDRSANGYYLNQTAGGYNQRVSLYPGSTSTNTGTTSGQSAGGVYVGGAYTGVSIQNAGSGGAHNNVQPTLVTNFIVKT